jgi:ribosomal protein S18 acetylase RimI-like enzyme
VKQIAKSFSIRRAAAGDSPSLTRLALEAKAHWEYPAAWLDSWREALTITPEYIASHTVLVAESAAGQPKPLGVCALGERGDRWQLEHLWVDPGAHRAGIGRALVQCVLAIAGSRDPGCTVRVESDPHAAEFYRRLGAREVGAVPAPMDGDPARVLPLFELDAPAAAASADSPDEPGRDRMPPGGLADRLAQR